MLIAALVVVLPTPPLPDVTTMMFANVEFLKDLNFLFQISPSLKQGSLLFNAQL